jgi:hypothetical protein
MTMANEDVATMNLEEARKALAVAIAKREDPSSKQRLVPEPAPLPDRPGRPPSVTIWDAANERVAAPYKRIDEIECAP